MRYLSKRFSVPAAGPTVTDEAWDAIFGADCAVCGRRMPRRDAVLIQVVYPEPAEAEVRCAECASGKE